jgi:glyceraldehyde 3-phosphate dehydrogenase
VDGLSTAMIDGDMLKVLSWYDNETGYSARILDLIAYIAKTL